MGAREANPGLHRRTRAPSTRLSAEALGGAQRRGSVGVGGGAVRVQAQVPGKSKPQPYRGKALAAIKQHGNQTGELSLHVGTGQVVQRPEARSCGRVMSWAGRLCGCAAS